MRNFNKSFLEEFMEEGMSRRRFLGIAGAAGLTALISPSSLFGFIGRRRWNVELFEIDVENPEKEIRLTTNPGADAYGSYFPNGEIAFSSFKEGTYDIYVMSSARDNITRITNNKALNAYPTVSPDGRRIIYLSRKDLSQDIIGEYAPWEILCINSDGTNLRKIGDTLCKTIQANYNVFPLWFPDGDKIIYKDYDNKTHRSTTYITNLKDEKRTFRLFSDLIGDVSIAISSDGGKIAFPIYFPKQGRNIYVVTGILNPDNSINEKNFKFGKITHNKNSNDGPVWFPDNTQLAYFSTHENPGIYKIKFDGSGRKKLLESRIEIDGCRSYSISPDGTKMSFIRGPYLCVVNTDGSNERRLIRIQYTDFPIDTFPRWSPDGKRILYHRLSDEIIERVNKKIR